MNKELVFLDTETTGLDPDRHHVWDIGLIRGATGEEIEWHITPDLKTADSTALRMTNYYGRSESAGWKWSNTAYVAGRVAVVTAGKHIVGAVPSFDVAFLERLLRRYGYAPAWHYHLVGVNPNDFSRHTALGDARWVRAQYEALMKEPTK